jgi:AraC-like DNA-binding protein
LKNEIREARVGDLLFLKPGIFHEEWSNSKPALETIFFSFECANEYEFVDIPLLVHDSLGRLRHLAEWMLTERYAGARQQEDIPGAFFYAFIKEMKRLAKGDLPSFIDDIRNAVITNPTGNHSLDVLAEKAGTSKYHFLRKFKRIYGFTPTQEVRRIRINMAMDLLLTTHEPLKVIADRTGLGTEINLTRLFKKFYGHPPSSFKK